MPKILTAGLLALALVVPANASVHELSFASGDVTLPALLHVPDSGSADTVVIYLHGNPGRPLAPESWLVRPLLDRGIAVFRFNYRGLWGNAGAFHLTNSLGDLDAALDFITTSEAVRSQGVAAERVVLFGYSYGTAVSVVGGAGDDRVDGIALLTSCDHGYFGAESADPDSPLQPFLEAAAEALFGPDGPIPGGAEAFVGDLTAYAEARRFPPRATELRARKLLLLAGLDDTVCPAEDHFFPLYRALRSVSHPAVEAVVLGMDHGTTPIGRGEIARRLATWVEVSGGIEMSTLPLSNERLDAFARAYTAAWNSGDPSQVASHHAEDGSLTINGGTPAVGREALTAVAASFMTAFPDLELTFDGLTFVDGRVEYHWTFEGTNTGAEGTGNRVRFSGFESWVLDADGRVTESIGTFDAEDYERQLRGDGAAR